MNENLLKYSNGQRRRQPCPQTYLPYTHWPTCPTHGGVPVRSEAGWVYCERVGWHEDPALSAVS